MNKIPIDFVHDGTKLYSYKSIVENSKAVICIVHGLGEHCGRYDYFTQKLNDAGYSVYSFDLYGHGQSEGKRGYLDRFDRYVDEAVSLVNIAKSENPGKKVFLFGHSMGGCVAAYTGEREKGLVDGVILSGACTDTPPAAAKLTGIIKILGSIAPNATLGNSLGDLVSRDPAVVELYNTDPLNLKKLTFALYKQFCVLGTSHVKNNAKSFSYPVLILHGGEDKLSDPSASVNFEKNISSQDKTLKIYDGLFHEILNEPEKDEVINDILIWLSERVN
ncbi:MAG: alpha/beta hydrolase [Anaerofustis stercorihominis]|nr:alpha/beta hydrolase [Anaerofustis stercorihominis]